MEFINSKKYLTKNTGTIDINGDTNNCVVRALAVLLDCSYGEAYEYSKKNLNRKHGKGVWNSDLVKHLRENLKTTIPYNHRGAGNPTFNQFSKNGLDVSKSYFLIVRGHAIALKNGVLYGNDKDAKISRKRLWGVYEF